VKRSAARGLTLVEAVLTAGLLGLLLLVAFRLLRPPMALQGWISEAEVQRQANAALDILVSELKQAPPGSLSWDPPWTSDELAFGKALSAPRPDGMILPSRVGYFLSEPTPGVFALSRFDGSERTEVLLNLEPPSADAPLFTREPELRIVMISLRVHLPGKPPLRIVRRVALRE
jgi:hypothetical protein